MSESRTNAEHGWKTSGWHESLSMTALLKEAYEASAAMGPDPTESDLERYDRAMSEIDRREALPTSAPGPTDPRPLDVNTPLGTLSASYFGTPGTYDGILVTLRKPDGTIGSVSLTEVAAAEKTPEGESRLCTWALNGSGGMERHSCNPNGPEMGYPLAEPSLATLEAECCPPDISEPIAPRTAGHQEEPCVGG